MTSSDSGYRGAAYYSSEESKKEYRPPVEKRDEPVTEKRAEEKDIEAEIKQARMEKRRAESSHDVTILRQKAAENCAQGAKFYGKYRAEEAYEVKFTQLASRSRRKAEALVEKSKTMETKAADLMANQGNLKDKKLEKNKIKVAKFKQKSAKFVSKSASSAAKAAKYDQKALAKRTKAKQLLEKSKVYESEGKSYNDRADRMEKAL